MTCSPRWKPPVKTVKRKRFFITPRGLWLTGLCWFAAVLGLISPNLQTLAMGAFLLWVILVVVDVAQVSQATPRIERHLPTHLSQGTEFPVQLSVTFPVAYSAHLKILDEPSDHFLDSESILCGKIQNHLWQGTYLVCPRKRGEHFFDTVHALIEGPLRLGGVHFQLPLRQQCLVHPISDLTRDTPQAANLPGSRRRRFPGDGGEFSSLRPYVRDDDARRIDWKASARSVRPVVRQMEAERNQRIVVMLDAGRRMAHPHGKFTRLDHGVRAAIGILRAARLTGDSGGLLIFAREISFFAPPRRSAETFRTCLDRLVHIEPRATESDPHRAVNYLIGNLKRRSLIVFLSDLADPSADDFLIPALQRLRKHHRVLAGHLNDPAAAEILKEPIQHPVDICTQAAALRFQQEVHHHILKLKHQDIQVVCADADDFPRRLSERMAAIRLTGI